MKNSTILIKLNRIYVHLLTILSVVLIFSCQEYSDLFPTISSEVTTDYLLNEDLVVYLQNEQVFRYKGKPGITTIQIGKNNLSDFENCFILYVASGAESLGAVPSVVIKLDGQQILNTSDFSNKEVQHDFEVCNLTEQSILEVEIRGEPGSYLDIWMEGKLKNIGSVTDIDGNTYKTVKIGEQWWMAENLRTTRLNNGDPIPLVTDPTKWGIQISPGFCWYDNDPDNYKNTYGALYNWYSANTSTLCPEGWHVPSRSDWMTLINLFGGQYEAGGALKETGYDHWQYPNTGATNISKFTALPGGYRNPPDGRFYVLGQIAYFWGSGCDPDCNFHIILYNDIKELYPVIGDSNFGSSIRCIKDY